MRLVSTGARPADAQRNSVINPETHRAPRSVPGKTQVLQGSSWRERASRGSHLIRERRPEAQGASAWKRGCTGMRRTGGPPVENPCVPRREELVLGWSDDASWPPPAVSRGHAAACPLCWALGGAAPESVLVTRGPCLRIRRARLLLALPSWLF